MSSSSIGRGGRRGGESLDHRRRRRRRRHGGDEEEGGVDALVPQAPQQLLWVRQRGGRDQVSQTVG